MHRSLRFQREGVRKISPLWASERDVQLNNPFMAPVIFAHNFSHCPRSGSLSIPHPLGLMIMFLATWGISSAYTLQLWRQRAACSPRTSPSTYKTIWYHTPEDKNGHCCENRVNLHEILYSTFSNFKLACLCSSCHVTSKILFTYMSGNWKYGGQSVPL